MAGKTVRPRHLRRWLMLAFIVATGLAVVTVLQLSGERGSALVSPVADPSSRPQAVVSVSEPNVQFTDVTAAAGIRFTHFAGATGQKWYPETIGSGAGFFDFDADGWPDILLVNGTSLTSESDKTPGQPEATLQVYRNRRDGTFENVTAQTGMAVPVYGMGLAAGDIDNDGDREVLITGYQHNLFFINNGDGTFTEAARRVGIADGEWGAGAAFFDYDRDGYLDLVISNYIEWTPTLEQGLDCSYGMAAKDYCPVRYFKGQGLRLYHNRGDGTFEDTTLQAGVRSQGSRAFAPYIFDFDEDQWPDIFVASDGTPSLLYRNLGNGRFEDVGVRSGIVLDETGAAYAGMGIDGTYPKNDAQLCIAIGNFVGEPTTLHCRVQQGESYLTELYTEVSAWAGIGRPTLRWVTFGLFFFDADLDGFEDLFMVNGHVVDEARLRNSPRAQPPQLFRNLGNGKFSEIHPPAGSGLDTVWVGRGAAYADYDGDGDLDILITQNQGPARLLRNDTPQPGHFLRVQLQGTTSNRDGIGAVVQVSVDGKVLKQMLRTGRSYFSQHEFTLTFGLGPATRIDRVEVVWPSGLVDVYHDLAANTTLRVLEGSHATEPHELQARPVATVDSQPQAQATVPPDATTSQAFLEHVHTGINAYDAKRYAEAMQAFAAAIKLNPQESLPYRYLAELYWRQGAQEQAEQTIDALAAVLPDAYFLDRLGNAFEEDGLQGLAVMLYKSAVRINPEFPSARYNLGLAYLKQGALQRGIAEIQEALRLYPEFAEAYHTLGLAYAEQGQLDLALTHLQRALQFQPDLTAARNDLARIYMAQGRLDDAIRMFETLLAQTPDAAAVHHNLAVAYARQGRRADALKQFRQVLALQPDFHAARIDMATLLLEIKRPQEAIEALQHVLTRVAEATTVTPEVDRVEVQYRLSIAYLMAGQVDTAIESFEAVLGQKSSHAGAHLYLARIYYERGQFDRAWTYARQAEALGAPAAELIAALQRVSVEPQ